MLGDVEEEIEGWMLIEDLSAVTTTRKERLLGIPEVRTHHDGSISWTVMSTRRRDMGKLMSTTFRTGIGHIRPVVSINATELSFVIICIDNSYRKPPTVRTHKLEGSLPETHGDLPGASGQHTSRFRVRRSPGDATLI
jgi:hypothetical protein